MIETESQRLKREREYQVKLLDALHGLRPQKKSLGWRVATGIAAVIGGTIKTIFSTAVLLAAFGAYVPLHKTCVEEANKLRTIRNDVGLEILYRQRAFINDLIGVEDPNNAPALPTTKGSIIKQYSATSYASLLDTWSDIEHRVITDDLPDTDLQIAFAKLAAQWMSISSKAADVSVDDVIAADEGKRKPVDPLYILQGRLISAKASEGYLSLSLEFSGYVHKTEANCSSPLVLFFLALGDKPPILRDEISASYSLFKQQAADSLSESSQAANTLENELSVWTNAKH